MSVLKVNYSTIARNEGKPRKVKDGVAPWSRPSDWLEISSPSSTEQRFGGLVAVYNNSSNYIALLATVSSAGQYTVDWGDGTTTDHATNTVAQKNYIWSDLSSTTLTSDGHRQAIINVTPKTTGTVFQSVDYARVHSSLATSTGGKNVANPWLDVYVSASSATSLAIGGRTISGNSYTCTNSLIERAQIIAHNTSSFASLFSGARALATVSMIFPNNVTSTKAMFADCINLREAPMFDMSSVIDASEMFANCRLIESIPSYRFSSVRIANNWASACSSLLEGPNIDTSAVTNASAMFSDCTSMENIPLYNLTAATNTSSMFFGCRSMIEFPAISTPVSVAHNTMFGSCTSLIKPPSSISISSSTNLQGMFTGCTRLKTVHSLDSSKAVSATQMFQNCHSLSELPDIDLSSTSSVGTGDQSLGSASSSTAMGNLKKVVLTGNKWSQTLQFCSLGATELNNFYTGLAKLNPSVTSASGSGTTVTYTVGTADIKSFVANRTVTITGVDPVAYNLTNAIVASVNTATGTFTVTNAATGAYVSGGVATIQDNKTITVTGNPGTTADDPTIATNKGWTVTG